MCVKVKQKAFKSSKVTEVGTQVTDCLVYPDAFLGALYRVNNKMTETQNVANITFKDCEAQSVSPSEYVLLFCGYRCGIRCHLVDLRSPRSAAWKLSVPVLSEPTVLLAASG